MKKKYIFILIPIIIIIILLSLFLNRMPNFYNKPYLEAEKYANSKNLIIEKIEEYNDTILKGNIISQSIKPNSRIKNNQKLVIKVSRGIDMTKLYQDNQVNELGVVPIMMYHGIFNVKSADTAYTGGNVDSSGYNRTAEAFINDLEFYYQNNYRMIRLKDYIDGKIDVPMGKSPIILTFDDGQKNNFNVLGIDDKGELIIDPNSAVGILESFKAKYPDYQVTATFFMNGRLFDQLEYNDKILKWLVNHGYDIGSHTYNHQYLDQITKEQVSIEMGKLYEKLDSIIPGKYVNIVALPFGHPRDRSNPNFETILHAVYNNKTYDTEATLQVGWQSNYSPFSKSFDKQLMKRIRAYDNNGMDYDIQMNFKLLEKTRYISDGNVNIIVIKKEDNGLLNVNNTLEVVTY